MFMYLLFDIGGTKTRVALSADLKKIGALVIIPTPKNFKDGIAVLKKAFLKIASDKKIKAICGGIAGPLDKNKTKLINAPNLREWINKPLKKELEKIFNTTVYLNNDADLAGLGEAVFGAGKNKSIVAYMTISTGVGGTRIVNGTIDKSAIGFEPGHQIINFYGPACACGGQGHLESYISGPALKNRHQKEPYDIMDNKIWDGAAKILAYGINNTIIYWSPDIVILGGSVMNKIPISRVDFYLKKIIKIFVKFPPIKKAALGDLSGFYGAMAFLRNNK